MSKDKYVFANWNTFIKITIIGMWGHDAHTKTLRYSGAKGHYPNTEYRFTLYGDASIHADKYADQFITPQELYVGFSNGIFRIDEIKNEGEKQSE